MDIDMANMTIANAIASEITAGMRRRPFRLGSGSLKNCNLQLNMKYNYEI
jgi:hypothetical protein